jgi:hypothetical protein
MLSVLTMGDGSLCPDHRDLLAVPGHEAAVVSPLRDWLGRPGQRILDPQGHPARVTPDRSPARPRSPRGHCCGPLHALARYLRGVPGHPARSVPQETSVFLAKRLAAEGVTHQTIRSRAVPQRLDTLRELHQAQWGRRSGFLPVFDRFAAGFAGDCAADEVAIHELGNDNLVVGRNPLDTGPLLQG